MHGFPGLDPFSKISLSINPSRRDIPKVERWPLSWMFGTKLRNFLDVCVRNMAIWGHTLRQGLCFERIHNGHPQYYQKWLFSKTLPHMARVLYFY